MSFFPNDNATLRIVNNDCGQMDAIFVVLQLIVRRRHPTMDTIFKPIECKGTLRRCISGFQLVSAMVFVVLVLAVALHRTYACKPRYRLANDTLCGKLGGQDKCVSDKKIAMT